MKRSLSLMLISAIITVLFAACGAQDTNLQYTACHTLYFKDSAKSSKATATFFNSDSGKSEDVEMEKVSEDDDSVTFSCEGNCIKYNMAYITCDGESKDDVSRFQKFAFNRCVSGWYRTEDDLLPYAEGEAIDYQPVFEDVTLTGIRGDKKKIHIWTPDGYDPSSKEKYATVYVLDGQLFVYLGGNDQMLKGCPVLTQQVKAMTAATDQKAIVVAVESSAERNYEYVPEIGESLDVKYYKERHGETANYADEFDGMSGTQLADFFAHTLVPYVQEHYNVCTDAMHTGVTGGSLGGLEAFYIAAEYPDIFGTAGGLSPSFWEFEDDVWDKYLGEKDFDENAPFFYFYTGPEDGAGEFVTKMVQRLKDLGYPEELLALHYDEEGLHDSTMWRNVYSEFLSGMIYRRVDPLQSAYREEAGQ